MALNFNIVYTSGNVQYLRLFVLSLLKWSDCTFRLVSNGLDENEVKILKEFCKKNSRLDYFSLPFPKMVSHGKVLTYLQSIETSRYFCFMDSDIFATGDFMCGLEPYLSKYTGIFSGTAIWLDEDSQTMPSSCHGIGGRFNRTADGICLGSTFFAIYDNQILNQVIKESQISFNKYYKWDEITPTIQQAAMKLGLHKRKYDTAKLLNILLVSRGYKLVFKDIDTLCHLGGLSTLIVGPLSKIPQKGFKRFLKETGSLFSFNGINKTFRKLLNRQKHFDINYEKRDIADHFSNLLVSIFAGKPFAGTVHVHDEKILQRIQLATTQIENLYKEFEKVLS